MINFKNEIANYIANAISLPIDEIESFQIKFSNLKKCPKGKYRAAFSIVINNNIIKDKDNAEIFLIHFNII